MRWPSDLSVKIERSAFVIPACCCFSETAVIVSGVEHRLLPPAHCSLPCDSHVEINQSQVFFSNVTIIASSGRTEKVGISPMGDGSGNGAGDGEVGTGKWGRRRGKRK